MQRHSTVSEFCSRQRELRENSSSARSCVRELRENSSSAGAVFSSAPQTATPPNAFRKLFKKEALLHIKLRTNQRSKPLKHLALKGYTIQSHSTVNEFCSRLGELRENSSSARSCNAPLPYSKVMCFLNALLSERPPKRAPNAPRKRLPKASQREALLESKLPKTNDPSLSNTWPPQKGYTMQRHSTVSEFCSRQMELLREKSSSPRICVRELRENSSSA